MNNSFSSSHNQESNHNQSISPTPPTDEENHQQSNLNTTNKKESESISLTAVTQSNVDVQQNSSNPIPPPRKRRKTAPLSKLSRTAMNNETFKLEKNTPPTPSLLTKTSSSSSTTEIGASTKSNATMIFNLIRSFLEEKKSDHNDENLISTIDCLIDSLQHLRDRIKYLDNPNGDHDNHAMNIDETSPLNLSKPKKRHHSRLASNNSDDISPTTTTVNSPSPSASTMPLSSTHFSSQSMFYDKPFFPPFSG